MLTNCKNCGASLKNGKCNYCGTEYEFIPQVNDFREIIKINIYGTVRKFYVSCIEVSPYDLYKYSCRDINGHVTHVARHNTQKITLELVSYD